MTGPQQFVIIVIVCLIIIFVAALFTNDKNDTDPYDEVNKRLD